VYPKPGIVVTGTKLYGGTIVNSRSGVVVIAVAVVYLAVFFVLVRPGSQGPTLVTNVSNGFTNLIKAATGGGSW
jgi:hypothetical protein